MTTMNTNERKERLKQIRERWSHPGALNDIFSGDIQFLLSLLDSQASTKPVGWISCGMRRDRIVDIVFENNDCAEAFLNGVEPAVGPIVAATRMRDACVAKVNELTEPHRLSLRFGTGATGQRSRTVIRFANEVTESLQSLTLDQVEQKEVK